MISGPASDAAGVALNDAQTRIADQPSTIENRRNK
jgi:hypothetical protein